MKEKLHDHMMDMNNNIHKQAGLLEIKQLTVKVREKVMLLRLVCQNTIIKPLNHSFVARADIAGKCY